MKMKLAVYACISFLFLIHGALSCTGSLIEHAISLNVLKSLNEEQFRTMLKAEKASQEMINLILFAAVEKGYLRAVYDLIEHMADVNARDSESYTSLDRAIFRGNISIIIILHKHGAQLGVQHRSIEVVMAVLCKDVRRVRLVLLNCTEELQRQLATCLLNLAVCSGYIDITKVLIDFGANLSAQFGGLTPLHCAVLNSNTILVDYLLKMGAEKNAADINGNTPLHMAAWIGDLNIVRSLVACEASINGRNRLRATPYMLRLLSRA